jgi:CheY-like chemotaxis protein
MNAEQRAKLFQPFAQADSSTTRRFGGSGLGLSIVRRLAQLMGGDVMVDSEEDQGSSFTVTLCLRAAPTDVMPAQRPLAVPALRPTGGHLLVVDDHPVNREVLMRQLGLLGLTADTAVDGIEALALWRPGRYVTILADMHMPRMDGFGLTAAIRAQEVSLGVPRTPIVAVTANAMRGEEERCLGAGMDAYIPKPVSLERLRETLVRWMAVGSRQGEATHPKTTGVDREALRAWMGDDDAAIDGLLARFLDSARQSARDIVSALSRHDLSAAAAAAHRLKGASLSVGATGLGEVAAQVEGAAKSGDHLACDAALLSLAARVREVEASIRGA